VLVLVLLLLLLLLFEEDIEKIGKQRSDCITESSNQQSSWRARRIEMWSSGIIHVTLQPWACYSKCFETVNI
jgi:hypothetical protein